MDEGEFLWLNEEVRGVWDQNAAYWDERMGDQGNAFHRMLVAPAQERLLELRAGERVLEVACGNGQFARRMASMGARVVACDFSPAMVQRARAREKADSIQYAVVDATSWEQLLALGPRTFDAAVCGMAIMDMAAIEPLVSSLGLLLKPEGRFVFSICHPCFNSTDGLRRTVEEVDREGELVREYRVSIARYIRPATYKGLAIQGQPRAQHYFHRPLSLLFNTFFEGGLCWTGWRSRSLRSLGLPVALWTGQTLRIFRRSWSHGYGSCTFLAE